ncbi:NF038122 family metalloprotease [Acidiphilium sp.]|uniref:NF038122 family metalloprotease n=1 Tax=Acidiphilium sp. TaxID=527 RepID=UPI003D012BA2
MITPGMFLEGVGRSGMISNPSDLHEAHKLSATVADELKSSAFTPFSEFKSTDPVGSSAAIATGSAGSVAALAASDASNVGHHMTIVVQDAPGVTLSAAAQNALNYAAQYLGALITDPVAVTIQANIANLNSVSQTGILAYGSPEAYYVPYFIAEGEVAKHDPSLAPYLPKTNTAAGGVAAVVSKAELQAWGLPTQGYYSIGGSIVINTAYQSLFNYSTNNVLQAANTNSLDFVGLALHELSHALGRVRFDQVTAAAGRYAGDPLAGPMDLSAFTSPGTLQHSATHGVGPIPYFSTDGGKTPIVYAATQTRTDWNNYMQNGAFLHDAWSGYLFPGLATMSATDLTLLNAIGFDIACFTPGTRILTTKGDVEVEALTEGDEVILHDGGTAPIIWIGTRRLDLKSHKRPDTVQPVLIEAGALAPGMPSRDLLVSPDHALYLDGHLIPAKALINGRTVRLSPRDSITYYHIELPNHAVLYAEGTPAESYLETGNRGAFENGGVPVQLHPDFAQNRRETEGCAPFAETGPIVEAVRARILTRALISTTTDAAVQVIAVEGGAIIESRAAIPGYITADPKDRRRLGIKIAALHVDGRSIPLDHPELTIGWHDAEPDGRWTTGRALVPASLLQGGTLDVTIGATLAYAATTRRAA